LRHERGDSDEALRLPFTGLADVILVAKLRDFNVVDGEAIPIDPASVMSSQRTRIFLPE
jgi:hypothetical protein